MKEPIGLDLKLKLMDALITRHTEEQIKRREALGKFLTDNGFEDDAETRLSWKITMYWIRAIQWDDHSWMKAHTEQMKRVEGLENLERLRKLYRWSKAHPPKPQP